MQFPVLNGIRMAIKYYPVYKNCNILKQLLEFGETIRYAM